jgi:hypothetical protein
MVWELFKKVSTRVKAAAKSVKAQFTALICKPEPETPENCQGQRNSNTSKAGRAMNKGQWCRLTSSHAPIFSLFTYFGDRQ